MEEPRERRSLEEVNGKRIGGDKAASYQTLIKLSSEALTRTLLPESAQQQLFTSSSWAIIFTVRLFASKS